MSLIVLAIYSCLAVALVSTNYLALADASVHHSGDARLSSYPKGRIEIYKDSEWVTL